MLTSEVILGCPLSPKMQEWITVQIAQLWPHELPVEPREGRISCVLLCPPLVLGLAVIPEAVSLFFASENFCFWPAVLV